MKRKKLCKIILVILLMLALLCGILLGIHYWRLNKAQQEFREVKPSLITSILIPEDETDPNGQTVASEEEPYDITQNPDYIGWILVPGVNIDYPVMYTPRDPEFYLRRNFKGNYSYSGTPFLDADCSVDPMSSNLIIHGHNMKNGTMFSNLPRYAEPDYLAQHSVIWLVLGSTQYQYEVVAAIPFAELQEDEELDNRYNFMLQPDTEDTYRLMMECVESYRCFDTGVETSFGDRFITLVTCDYAVEHGRFAVIGRLVS
ncbi:class B sortase [Ligaoa zhengdingensis]|uniref:class B sortase n=1 Tax=Ligaoa zhengdingensis TaxID=2763658 RepID=UPI0031BBC6D7